MKLKPIYNNSTNAIIYDYIVYMEKNDLPEFITIESLDLPHFIGKIQHQQKEIEKLNNKLLKIKELINRTPRQTSKERAYIMLKCEIAEVIGVDKK